MTSGDFNAAQERILARQQRIAAERSDQELARQQRVAAFRGRFPIPGAERSLAIWDRLRSREGTKPTFRVGQLDSELLDEELLELLKAQVGEGLKFFGVSF
jgi:peroxin-2